GFLGNAQAKRVVEGVVAVTAVFGGVKSALGPIDCIEQRLAGLKARRIDSAVGFQVGNSKPRLGSVAAQIERLVFSAQVAGPLPMANADAGVADRRRQHDKRRQPAPPRSPQLRDYRALIP